jgi:hypothetical protein
MNKLAVTNRLTAACLRVPAEAYRDEVRKRLAKERGGEKRDREAVNDDSWEEMWELFLPLVEQVEKKKEKEREKEKRAESGDERTLSVLTDDIDKFLDPNYSENDPGKWLRDGLIWTAAEIRRVVLDSENETTIDLARAKTPPPTAWAVFCLESFARKSPDKRSDLIARVLTFATRSTNAPDDSTTEERSGGFLDSI